MKRRTKPSNSLDRNYAINGRWLTGLTPPGQFDMEKTKGQTSATDNLPELDYLFTCLHNRSDCTQSQELIAFVIEMHRSGSLAFRWTENDGEPVRLWRPIRPAPFLG